MKNYRNIRFIWLGILLCGLSSCEKDPWVYDVDQKAKLYILDYMDTVAVSFGIYTDTNWVRGSIGVSLLGTPVDYDRDIELEFVDSSSNITLGKDVIIPELFLPSESIGCNLIYWVRRPDSVHLEDGQLYFTVRLKENEFFEPCLQTTSFIRIYVSHPIQPNWWRLVSMTKHFGPYSEEAYKLFFKYYYRQRDLNTLNWQLYYKTVYGEDFLLMGISSFSSEQLIFLPYLKEDVMVPMFDELYAKYRDDYSYPDWYKEYKANQN